jgi:hypothetical protein
MRMRTLIDFYEIQPLPFETRGPAITMIDLDVTWEEPEQGPGLCAESLSRARTWCDE